MINIFHAYSHKGNFVLIDPRTGNSIFLSGCDDDFLGWLAKEGGICCS